MTELSKRDRELLAKIVGGYRPFTFQVDGKRLERAGYIRAWWDETDRIVFLPTEKGIEFVGGANNEA